MAFRSGFKADATINGVELSVVGWNVGGDRATIVRFVNSRSGNHPRKGATLTDSFFSIDFDWDDSVNPFAPSLNIKPGVFMTNVKLLLDGITPGTLFWSYPSAIVGNITQGAIVEGKISTRLECEADGPYGEPGGTVA